MKKLLCTILVLVFAFTLMAADEMPPMMPSSFWGTVRGYAEGTLVNARMDTVTGEIRASTNVFNDVEFGYGLVYSMDVPGTSEDEGRMIVFEIGGVKVGRGYWHSGTIVRVNLFAPPKR
jgi:hypothetical protein